MISSGDDIVSVIVPAYNRAKTVANALDSVLQQSHQRFELHVVDDGSKDQTWDVLQSYRNDPRVHVYRQENSGQAVARNRGLANSRGTFVCFLDSDNVWLPGKLEKQLAIFAEYPDTDVVYGDVITIDEQGDEISKQNMRRYSGKLTYQLLRDNCVSFNTAMTRRAVLDAVGGLDESVRYGDDFDLWLRLSVNSEFLYVPEFFAKYRVQEQQISTDKEARFASNRQIIERFLARNPLEITAAQRREIWSLFYQRRARYRSGVGRHGPAFGDVMRAAARRPASVGSLRTLGRLVLNAIGFPARN